MGAAALEEAVPEEERKSRRPRLPQLPRPDIDVTEWSCFYFTYFTWLSKTLFHFTTLKTHGKLMHDTCHNVPPICGEALMDYLAIVLRVKPKHRMQGIYSVTELSVDSNESILWLCDFHNHQDPNRAYGNVRPVRRHGDCRFITNPVLVELYEKVVPLSAETARLQVTASTFFVNTSTGDVRIGNSFPWKEAGYRHMVKDAKAQVLAWHDAYPHAEHVSEHLLAWARAPYIHPPTRKAEDEEDEDVDA